MPPDPPVDRLRAYLAWDSACPECLGPLDVTFTCLRCRFDAVDDAANMRLIEDEFRSIMGDPPE